MAAIEQFCLPPDDDVPAMWRAVAERAADWLRQQRVPLRDAVVLLPYAALLAPARAAFVAVAARGGEGGGQSGWMPRVETPMTLAQTLAPPPERAPGACNGEPLSDRLHGAEWLRGMPALAEHERHDPKGFALMVERLADAASALRASSLCFPPAQRPERWGAMRAAIAQQAAGPAMLEASLLDLAWQWASAGVADATDSLHGFEPGAWIAVQVGGPDELAEGALASAAVPALRIVADAAGDDPYAGAARPARLRRLRCEDAEAEAQAAATEVIEALNAGRVPVALVALDRSLVRRIRALLERRGVDLVDDTGWRLSTTVAGTRVVSLLRAARAATGSDERLVWLKGWPAAGADELRSLESKWRGSRFVPSEAAAARLADASERHLAGLRAGTAPLADWLVRLRETLAGAGNELALLRADPAGRQVLEALWLDGAGLPEHVSAAAQRWRADLPGFTAWVESALDAATFVPPLPAQGLGARVVIAPLARIVGRPFAQVVLPGADERHLAPAGPAPGLIGAAMAEALGLPTPAARSRRQRQLLAQLMRTDAVTVLRRRVEGGAALAASPDLECLWMAFAASGAPAPDEIDWAPEFATRDATPVPRPRPSAPDALPAALSATRIVDLRACPYRFFARAVLGLQETDELGEPLSKRDYGTWLHALLHLFHRERADAEGSEAGSVDDAARLRAAADGAAAELGLDAAELLPYQASFDAFAPAYLRWVRSREEQGWHWSEGETAREVAPAELAPARLKGVIDRVDRGPGGACEVLDYKSGDLSKLKRSVREPLEDTQLAVYAALLLGNGQADENLQAAYVSLDDADAPVAVPHEHVARSASAMLRHLGGEWARLRAGEPMQALGEEPCSYCEARGLCRRDHWGGDS